VAIPTKTVIGDYKQYTQSYDHRARFFWKEKRESGEKLEVGFPLITGAFHQLGKIGLLEESL